MADIKDVAKRAGVSISTVSRVINNSKNVSSELSVKVERAIEDLGYSTNQIARGLKISRTNNIAVIITSVARTFFTPVLEGIHKEADKKGYFIVIAETHDSFEKEENLVNLFASQWVDGIILASSAYGDDLNRKKYVKSLSELKKKDIRIPVVTLEFAFENSGVDAVVIDHEKAAYEAVSYLIEKAERRDIIHVSLPVEHRMGQQRIRGYRRALEDHGLEIREDYIIEGDYTTYSGYKAMKRAIEGGRKFDAIFCANDQMAVGALKACEEHGIRVPDQAAVIGNDDVFAASIVTPALSSIYVPKFELGAIALKRLEELMDASNAGRTVKSKVITLGTKIVERESTCKGAKNSLKYLEW